MSAKNLKKLKAISPCVIDDAPKLTIGKFYDILRWEEFTEPDTGIQDICVVIKNDVDREHYFGTAYMKECFEITE